MRMLGSLGMVLMTLGWGPSPGEETTSGTDTDGPSPESTSAPIPTTGSCSGLPQSVHRPTCNTHNRDPEASTSATPWSPQSSARHWPSSTTA